MDWYKISEDQLEKITKFGESSRICLYSDRQHIAGEIRSNPYNPMAEQKKILDELFSVLQSDGIHALSEKLKELRQEIGQEEQ